MFLRQASPRQNAATSNAAFSECRSFKLATSERRRHKVSPSRFHNVVTPLRHLIDCVFYRKSFYLVLIDLMITPAQSTYFCQLVAFQDQTNPQSYFTFEGI